MKAKKLAALAASAVMAASLAAPVMADEATSAADDAALSAEDLNVMFETPVESLDPQQATDGTSFEVIADYTDGLMQMDADGAAVPAIAESYDLSDDGLTYTFHLRDAKWTNGDAVTANDFVFAWRRIAKEAGEYAYMLDEIGNISDMSIKGIDGMKLQTEGMETFNLTDYITFESFVR